MEIENEAKVLIAFKILTDLKEFEIFRENHLNKNKTDLEFKEFLDMMKKNIGRWLREGSQVWDVLRTLDSECVPLYEKLSSANVDPENQDFKTTL